MDKRVNMKSLKTALKFWQEIVFIIGLGWLVSGITLNAAVAFKQGINIVFYCIFILLIMCLIGQFFWKNFVLALWLAVMFGLSSLYMTFGWFVEIFKMTDTWGVVSLFFFIGLTVAAITMPIKYLKFLNNDKSNKSCARHELGTLI